VVSGRRHIYQDLALVELASSIRQHGNVERDDGVRAHGLDNKVVLLCGGSGQHGDHTIEGV